MSKQDHIEAAVATLQGMGFVEAGETRVEHVRIGTARTPVYGGTGGERRTFGGRLRMAFPDSDLRVSLGPKTVCVYHTAGSGKMPQDMQNVPTRDLEALREAVASRMPAGPGARP